MKKGLLHHIEINCSNLEQAKAFWNWWLVDTLGYSIKSTWEGGISYELGNSYLVFIQTEASFNIKEFHRKCSGLNHLAFHGSSRKMLDDLIPELTQKGIIILYPDKYPYAGGKDHYALYFEGPDRIKIELVAPKISQ